MSWQRQPDLTVLLENVHDPHNISAVLRSCDAVGIIEIFILYTDPAYSISKVKLGKRTSAGARKWIDVQFFTQIEACVKSVREKYGRVLGARIGTDTDSLYSLDLCQPTALVFGNEHQGISEGLSRHLDGYFTIPLHGMVQSLNISVACAVSLFEASNQRMSKGMYRKDYEPFIAARKVLEQEYLIRNSRLEENYHIIRPGK